MRAPYCVPIHRYGYAQPLRVDAALRAGCCRTVPVTRAQSQEASVDRGECLNFRWSLVAGKAFAAVGVKIFLPQFLIAAGGSEAPSTASASQTNKGFGKLNGAQKPFSVVSAHSFTIDAMQV